MKNNYRMFDREYKLFLLRLWRESPQDPWRISVQANDQAKQVGLPTLDDLLRFFEQELALDSAENKPDNNRQR